MKKKEIIIKEAIFFTRNHYPVFKENIKEGYVIQVEGILENNGKKNIINTKIFKKNGEFFLENNGRKVNLIPKEISA